MIDIGGKLLKNVQRKMPDSQENVRRKMQGVQRKMQELKRNRRRGCVKYVIENV